MDPLLEPFTLRGLTLRNRVMSTGHEPTYSVDGMPADRYLRYQVEKARGGVGLTVLGASVVAPESTGFANNIQLWRDDVVPHLRRMSEAVHEHGTALMAQITHEGRRTLWNAGAWLPLISPSSLREPQHKSFPKEAEDWDIARAVAAFVDAAERCRAGGLDGVELMGYGHLLDAFWSPATNRREDAWGGDFDRRMRFAEEIVSGIKRRCGDEFVVGVRMAIEEDLPGGLAYDDGIAVVRRLTPLGLDFLNVIRGNQTTDHDQAKVIAPMGTPSAPHLQFTGRVRKDVSVPVMHANRIADVSTARHALRDGLVDLVGMTRAHIADPHLVAKVRAGNEDRIRPCVGASLCVDRLFLGLEALCIHNASTGRERDLPHEVAPAVRRRRAVVVGAGPGGLEAARVLAERGHEVVLLEANGKAGGQLRIAAAVAHRHDLIGIVDWRVSELARLGVTVRYGQFADAAVVRGLDPDVVVVASGGLPNLSEVDDPDGLALSTWDVLTGERRVSGRVLVYDDNGDHHALGVAEHLGDRQVHVDYVTPERVVGPHVGGITMPLYLEAFSRNGTTVTLNERLMGIRKQDGAVVARLRNEYTRTVTDRQVDHVVVEHGTLPVDDVYFELRPGSSNGGAVDQGALLAGGLPSAPSLPGSFELYRVGDAIASRGVHAAVLDAFRLCRVL